jgi:hypothetical protein
MLIRILKHIREDEAIRVKSTLHPLRTTSPHPSFDEAKKEYFEAMSIFTGNVVPVVDQVNTM